MPIQKNRLQCAMRTSTYMYAVPHTICVNKLHHGIRLQRQKSSSCWQQRCQVPTARPLLRLINKRFFICSQLFWCRGKSQNGLDNRRGADARFPRCIFTDIFRAARCRRAKLAHTSGEEERRPETKQAGQTWRAGQLISIQVSAHTIESSKDAFFISLSLSHCLSLP